MPRAEPTVTEACQLIVQALDLNFGRGDTAEEPSPLSLQHVPPHAVAAAARLELGLSEPPPGTSVKGHLRPLCEQLGIPTPGWPLPGESPRVIVTEEAARPDKWASSLLDQSVEVPTSAALVAEEDGGVTCSGTTGAVDPTSAEAKQLHKSAAQSDLSATAPAPASAPTIQRATDTSSSRLRSVPLLADEREAVYPATFAEDHPEYPEGVVTKYFPKAHGSRRAGIKSIGICVPCYNENQFGLNNTLNSL